MNRNPSVWREIGRSWMALKLWVKVWLFFLNGVFLAGFAFLDDPVGVWSLVAYAAAGPLLLGMAVVQQGLTRALGLAHIVPWAPLMAYLMLRLGGDLVGPQLTAQTSPMLFGYVLLILTSVGLCLAFDVWDLARWLRGERFIMGSEEAYEAGASLRARS